MHKTTKTKTAPRGDTKKKEASVAPKIRDRCGPDGNYDTRFDARDVILSYKTLTNRDFDNKNLRLASFVQANLRNASFHNADCSHACFAGSDLTDVDFSGAVLRDADLTRCLTVRTNFGDAELEGALVAPDFNAPIPDEYVVDKHETPTLSCLKIRRRTINDEPSVSAQIKRDEAELRAARVDHLEAMRAQGYAFISDLKLLGGADVVVTYRTTRGVEEIRDLLRIHWAYVQKLRRVGSLKKGERADFLSLRRLVARKYPTVSASLLMREEQVHALVAAIEKEGEASPDATSGRDAPVPMTFEDEPTAVLQEEP
ncbi:MAG: pentapeptide repeat-containing protein [Polyangiales bacterium]